MAEISYRRFLFTHHSAAVFEPMLVGYTHFVARVKSANALRLNAPPFNEHGAQISHPTSYAASQILGARMRQEGTELFTYSSARHPKGVHVGVFSVEAFAQNEPIAGKNGHWSAYVSDDSVEFKRPHLADNAKESYVFYYEDFCANGKFAATPQS